MVLPQSTSSSASNQGLHCFLSTGKGERIAQISWNKLSFPVYTGC